jgi:hypothetical protein
MWTKYLSFMLLAMMFMNSHPAVAQNEFDYNNWPGREGAIKTDIEFPVAPFLGYGVTISRIYTYTYNSSILHLILPRKKSPDSPVNSLGIRGEINFHVYPTIIEAQYAMKCISSDYAGYLHPKRLIEPPVGDVAIIVEKQGYHDFYFTRANALVYLQNISVTDTLQLFENLTKEIDEVIKNAPVWETGDPQPHIIITEEFQKVFSDPSAVNEDYAAESPQVFILSWNAPNPFNPATVISFRLLRSSSACLSIYDAIGREVAVLAEGFMSAGNHEVRWNGRDSKGAPVSSGVYFYRLEAGGKAETRKMMLMR